MICYDDINQNKAEIPLILDTVISEQNILPGRRRAFRNEKGRVKEDITTLNVYAPKNKASKYKKQNPIASHEKMSETLMSLTQ